MRLSGTGTGEIQAQPLDIDSGTAGSVNLSIGELNNVDTTGLANNNILKYNSSTGLFEPASDSGIGLTDLSVTQNSAGTAALSYDNTTGVFTYTPPDLSAKLENVSEDTSPTLGGELDMDGNGITSTSGVTINRDGNNHGGVILISKDVGSGGDLARRTGTITSITDGTTTKFLGLNNWQDDATDGKKYQWGYLSDDASTTTILAQFSENAGAIFETDTEVQGVFTATEGTTANTIGVTTLSGNEASLKLTKIASGQTNRNINLQFVADDGSSTYNTHLISSKRNSGSLKTLTFQELRDSAGAPTTIMTLGTDDVTVAKPLIVDDTFTSNDQFTVNTPDTESNSMNVVTAMGSTDDIHNTLTGIMDYGANTILDGAENTQTFRMKNDSDEHTIGKIGVTYDSSGDNDNQAFILPVKNDASSPKKLVQGQLQSSTDTPFRLQPYAVASLPTTGISAGAMAYATDETGGAIPVFYDGTDWRRVSDRAVAS